MSVKLKKPILNLALVRAIFAGLMIIMFIITGIAGEDWQYSLTGAIGFSWIIFEMLVLNQIGIGTRNILVYLMQPVQKQADPARIPSHKPKKVDAQISKILERVPDKEDPTINDGSK